MRTFDTLPEDAQAILQTRICDLGLKLEGSPVELHVQQMYQELADKGLLKFKPGVYLSDEWGCPSGEPVIGIPFYLGDKRLSEIEAQVNDLETDAEIMMYLRHEAGHAFNYAYKLYRTSEWKQLFGPFRRAYRENYKPVAFSRRYVRHIAGWYAQKHPDEDFAETFAVWLTPDSKWRSKYKYWGALEKLEYMDRIGTAVGSIDPIRKRGRPDITTDDMEETVAQFYERSLEHAAAPDDLAMDTDLIDIFGPTRVPQAEQRAADELIHEHRKTLVDKVTYWTGLQRPTAKKLVESVQQRVRELELRVNTRREPEYVAELSVYLTALAMNYLLRGNFVQR
ncbi:MAG TPA: putative zinc-binding metallopeptidase [Terriglobales bacterium]|nr:putative zinc-binding metallopeptidase [Terriglobales bacterium]